MATTGNSTVAAELQDAPARQDLTLASSSPLEAIQRMVLDSVRSSHSKRAYGHALTEFMLWCRQSGAPGLSKATVQRFRMEVLESRGLAASSINIRLAAIRKLASEAGDNGLLAPDLAAGIARVRGVKRLGVRVGNWLNREQAEQLITAPDPLTRKGKRDRAMLALLIGCGLRRNELAELKNEHVQQREGRWVIIDLVGKGDRLRTVPMPSWAKNILDEWMEAAGVTRGFVFRSVNKGDRISGERMTPQAVFGVVKEYGGRLGFQIAPHDLRRTFAKLAHKGHAALEQIQLSLGHASIQTTEKYLGVKQDLHDAPCDRLGINVF